MSENDVLTKMFVQLNEADARVRKDSAILAMAVFEFLARKGLASREEIEEFLLKEVEQIGDDPKKVPLKETFSALAGIFHRDKQKAKQSHLRLIEGGLTDEGRDPKNQ